MASNNGGTKKTVGLILIAVLVLGLGGFGVTNFAGSSIRSVGSVGDADIPVNDYARALQNEIAALEAQVGQPVSFTQAQSLGVQQRVLSQLVVSAALQSEADTIGLSVGDERLAEELANIQAFKNPAGQFDRAQYSATLDRLGLSERDFETQLRSESAATLLQGAVLAGTRLPDTYVDTLVGYAGERRAFTWAELGADRLQTGLPAPSDDDLTAWYDENIASFTLPETKVITYAWLTPDMIIDTVEVEEAALREAYEEREAEFNLPERRLVERLVFADEAAAQAAADRLGAGEVDFEALVTERGLDLADTDLGDVTRDDLGDAADAVFTSEVGSVSGPAPSSLGPALFRVNAILPAQSTSFEEAEPMLRDTLALDRARRVIDGMSQSFDDEFAAGATLEELSDSTDLQLGSIDWHAASTDGIAGYDAFRQAAARLTADDFPEIDQLGDGGIFAMRLEEVRDPAPQPFEDVRDEVVAGWEREAQADALVEDGKALADRLSAGDSFDTLELNAQSEEGLTRTASPAGLPLSVIQEVFALEPGATSVVTGDGVAYLVQLDEVIAADRESEQSQTLSQIYADQAANDVAQDLFRALSTDIQTRAGVVIDEQALNAVHANFQ